MISTNQNSWGEQSQTNISTAKKLSLSQLANLKIEGFGKAPFSKKELSEMKQSIDKRVNAIVEDEY
jgi:hypothetical protein